jgi:ribosomal protein S27E
LPRKRTWTDEQFVAAVQRGRSVRSVLQALGLHATGANYKTVKDAVARLGLDTSHWKGQGYLRGLNHNFSKRIPLEAILVADSTFHNLTHLKSRLIRSELLDVRCAICGLTEWLGKPIALVLDHINGINNDHRLQNLRLLCPNCNSQQETFAGRNKRLRRQQAEAGTAPEQGDHSVPIVLESRTGAVQTWPDSGTPMPARSHE